MQPTDANRFNQILTGLCVTFGREPDAILLDAYWIALKDWPLPEFEAAAAHLLKTSKFMPRPADFTDLRKAARETSGEAFDRARSHARDLPVSGGFLQDAPSGDAFLDAVTRAIGGYRVLANASEHDLQFLEKRFAEHFETMSDAEDVREAVPQLGHETRRLGGTWEMAKLLTRAQ